MLRNLPRKDIDMIKIGTKKDLDKITHLPMNIRESVCEDVRILDYYYGADRNIDVDMGGFVVICDKDEKLDIANFDKNFDIPEFVQEICPYKKMLFLSGTERNIIIYEHM